MLIKKWILKPIIYFTAFTILLVFAFRFLPIGRTGLIYQRYVEQNIFNKYPYNYAKDWVSLKDVSPKLKLALVCSEDQLFKYHHGFDFNAIQKAFHHNAKSEKKKGGSTITQQVAKNVFLWPGRSYLRKALEAWFALWIEMLWSKERILEAYLNIIEFGNGIYGCEAASNRFFNKSAVNLNAEEAALLAAVVPGPLIYSVKKPSNYIKKKQKWILRNMRRLGNKAIQF